MLLSATILEILQVLLSLCMVFRGHYIGVIFVKFIILFFPFSYVVFLGRSFAWWLVATNMDLKLLGDYSVSGRLL